MFDLKALKVKGFRGYKGEKNFIFDNPAILLFGENHQGKSSTLNAIEWCLFGNECVGKGTGIRERIDWEIPNRNMHPPEVLIELKLKDKATKGELTIAREWISARKDQLKVILPDGQALDGEQAKEKLAQVLKSSFRDFLTTVYQHQEAIRAILTQEPKERNDAIDRLLGLSDYRNILSGVKAAKLPEKQRKMDNDFGGFAREIDIALRTRESDLKDKREKAVNNGLKEKQLCEKGALEIAGEVKDQLLSFASDVGLSIAELKIGEEWEDLQEFQNIADREIKKFRSEMPDVKKQQDLFKRRAKVTALKEGYKQKENDWDDAKSKFEIKEKESGKLQEEIRQLENKIKKKEKQLSESSAKAAVITNARDYLRLEGIDKDMCPVCETKKPDLLDQLEKKWAEKYENLVGAIQGELGAFKNRRVEINSWFGKYDIIKRSFEDAYKGIEEVKREIGGVLSREISDKDDPAAILDKALEEIKKKLEELEQAVRSKQDTLNGISFHLGKIQLIVEILRLEEKKKIVEEIQESSEYQRMEELKNEMAILIDDVGKIKQAISNASHKAAEEKVTAAGQLIDNYFQRIADNPSISKMEFSVDVDPRTGLNSYEFKDQNGKDLTPILSQGDLNGMALSIFLGMACSADTNLPFGFIILDDPSQSLGSGHKEKLVDVLDEVLKERMVVLSSMDKELQGLVDSKITKAKTKYIFSGWTRERGPEVKKE